MKNTGVSDEFVIAGKVICLQSAVTLFLIVLFSIADAARGISRIGGQDGNSSKAAIPPAPAHQPLTMHLGARSPFRMITPWTAL